MAGSGFFGVSVAPELKTSLGNSLFLGGFYQQHLGESFAGIAVNNQGITARVRKGFFRSGFEEHLPSCEGSEGVGFCGLTRQPFLLESRMGPLAVCLSGRIANRSCLRERYKEKGGSFSGREGLDTEVEMVSKLIAQGEDVATGIRKMDREVRGAYSLLVLRPKGIYAARSPDGHWPLVLAEKEKAVAVAFDSAGLGKLGFRIIRDLKPGEIVLLRDGEWSVVDQMTSSELQICTFFWVYIAFPNAVVHGIVASEVRKRLGAALARKDITAGFTPDIVAPVPDSGRFHAVGYAQEFNCQANQGKVGRVPLYDEILLKYPHATRSFTQPTQKERGFEARIKLLKTRERYAGKRVVLVDDSIVRGTQMEANLVPMVREIACEVHVRISNPELRSHCPWGKSTKKGQVLAARAPTKEEKVQTLDVDTLRYNSIEDLVESVGLPAEKLCMDCSLK